MFLRAHTTASVPKRQDSVLRSKYERYSLSGGTKNIVIIAATAAIDITGFFLMKLNTVFVIHSKFTCVEAVQAQPQFLSYYNSFVKILAFFRPYGRFC